jgi:hypothetical protein
VTLAKLLAENNLLPSKPLKNKLRLSKLRLSKLPKSSPLLMPRLPVVTLLKPNNSKIPLKPKPKRKLNSKEVPPLVVMPLVLNNNKRTLNLPPCKDPSCPTSLVASTLLLLVRPSKPIWTLNALELPLLKDKPRLASPFFRPNSLSKLPSKPWRTAPKQ